MLRLTLRWDGRSSTPRLLTQHGTAATLYPIRVSVHRSAVTRACGYVRQVLRDPQVNVRAPIPVPGMWAERFAGKKRYNSIHKHKYDRVVDRTLEGYTVVKCTDCGRLHISTKEDP